MKTYHVEEAVAKFRECFDEASLDYEIVDSDVNTVRVAVRRDEVTLMTWFDVKQQLWGFDLLNGGHKSCGNFEEFEDFFGTYLSIHTVFIPNAKTVTDAFEREYGINTVYDSFSGNKQNGYTAKFKVLGSGDQSVLVKRITEGYLVRLVVPDDVSGKFKVKTEYKYEIAEDGVVTPIPTIYMFMRRLKERYGEDNSKKIQRVGESLFTFGIEGLVVSAEISFNYMEVRYHITEVSCYAADFMLSPEDPYDLSAIYMACKDFYDDCATDDEGDVDPEESSDEPDSDESVEESGESSYTAGFDHEEAEAFRQEEAAAGEDAEKPFEDDFGGAEGVGIPAESEIPEEYGADQDEAPPEVAQQEGQSSDTTEDEGQEVEKPMSIMSVESIKKVVEGDTTVGVQFIVDGQPYIFGVDRVKAAGFPVKRIKETVNVVYKCGMKMTEDELRLKRYSDEYDDPSDVLSQILEAVFA